MQSNTFTFDITKYICDGSLWMGCTISSVILLVILYEFNFLWVRAWLWNVIKKNLVMLFTLILGMGFMTYYIGTNMTDSEESNFLTTVPMAIVHAAKMFVFDSDISAIRDAQHHSPEFMILYNVSHFFAALFSLIFILRYVGFYVTARIRLWWRSWLSYFGISQPHTLNIFWGINDDSLILAEDIKKKIKGDVLFVRILGDNESQTSKVGFSRIFNLIRLNDNEIDILRENSYHVTSTFRTDPVHKIDDKKFTVGETLGLRSLSRLMKHTNGCVNVFLFDDNDSANINNLVTLVRDDSLSNNKRTHFYLKARQNAANGVMAHSIITNKKVKVECQIHLVDTAYLAVSDLICNVESHPVNFVEVEKNCIVNDSFNAMLVGFGQTGENAFQYLYEFSTFANSKLHRSACHFTIADFNATQLWNSFVSSRPALKNSPKIECLDAKIGSADYWKMIKSKLDNLNYVLFATGNDEENLNAAVSLLNCVLKDRINLDKFAIYIRIYSPENEERILRVVNGYNNAIGKNILCVFGTIKKMISYENIVGEELLEEAKNYNANYEGKSLNEKDILWDKLSVELLYKKNNPHNSDYTYMAAISESMNKKEQNISNSQHRYTKVRLMGTDFINGLPEIKRDYGTIKYENLTAEQHDVMNVMACTEHLRWVAKQELLGYKYGTKKDYIRLTHPCMVEWNDMSLSDETKSWDCNVVDTSIKMYKSR